MNHVDVLFPEPVLPCANDSFYSVQSAQTASSSQYSSYSQEVKYIFEPKTSPRQSSRGSQESYRTPREPWTEREDVHSLHSSPRSSHDSTGSQKSPRVVNGSMWPHQGALSPLASPSTSASSWTYQEVARQASWTVPEEEAPPPYEASVAQSSAWTPHTPSSGGGQHNLAWAVTGRPPPYQPNFGGVSSEAGSRAPISTTAEDLYPPPRGVPDSYTHPIRSRHPPPHAHYPIRRTDSDARRRTWSPNTFERAMRMAPNFQLRSYRSNEQLDTNEGENHYEELDTLPGRNGIGSLMSPPRITPVSGRLQQPVKPPLIKPVAFKPVQPAGGLPRYGNTAPGPMPLRACPRSPHLVSPMSTLTSSRSTASYHTDASQSYTEFTPKGGERTVASGVPVPQSLSSSFTEAFVGTPSPSDSGLGELETMLRDKDAEIANLRCTLEQNETAILRVCEEKRQAWAAELREAGGEWERALRQQQQRALKMEQALLLQLYRLQQERKSARQDLETTRSEQTHIQQAHDQLASQQEELKQKCEQLQKDNVTVSAKLEESQWEVCQKVGEISLLKTQLKDGQDGNANKNAELLNLKNQIRDLTTSTEEKDSEITRLMSELEKAKKELGNKTSECQSLQQKVEQCPKDQGSSTNLPETDRLRAELLQCRSDLEKHRENYFSERDQWLDEKNKVIRYQKHLQLNYVQMYRKNKLLEKEVEQLLVEIENKDLKLMDEGGVHLNQESTC